MDARLIKVLVGVIYLIDISTAKTADVETLDASFLTWLVNNTDSMYLPVNKSASEVRVSCLTIHCNLTLATCDEGTLKFNLTITFNFSSV